MAVLKCDCGSKVESNRCCGNAMDLEGEKLKCTSCSKEVNVNNCCGPIPYGSKGYCPGL